MYDLFQFSAWAVFIATAVLLVWGFVRTRNLGYIVLLMAFPGWFLFRAVTSPLVERHIERIAAGHSQGFPFNLFGELSVGAYIASLHWLLQVGQAILVALGILLLVLGSPTSSSETASTSGQPEDRVSESSSA